jgi:peroxiredoxin
MATMKECSFSKLEHDTVFTALFNYAFYVKGELSGNTIFTGDALVHMTEHDSVAVIRTIPDVSTGLEVGGDVSLYKAITRSHKSLLLIHKHYADVQVEYLGETEIRGRSCHHIRMVYHPENNREEPLSTISDEYQFWINKVDDIPVQYINITSAHYKSDTLYQYQKRSLKTYDLNIPQDPAIFTLAAIPDYYRVKDYAPNISRDPLPNGIRAPNWRLPSLTGEHVRLQDLRGKVVLLDFFYNACAPCIMALPGLQSLHEKYADQGLHVIGINAFDKSAKTISDLMAKHGVTYPVLYHGQEVAETYLAQGYPMLYLIDRKGTIIYSKSGFGFSMEEELDAEVRKALDQ